MAFEEEDKEKEKRPIPWFPNFVITEVIAMYIMLAVLIVLASIFPAGLEEIADPLRTPPEAKPEWYFFWLYAIVKKVPVLVGIVTPVVALLLVLLVPFLDRNPERHPRKRIVAMTLGTLVTMAFLGLTIWGYLS